jgi:ubiquinone biosynthesis protein COQ9
MEKKSTMSYRESLFFIIVGTNGTGKTTLLNKLISQTNRKALILDPDGREWDEIQEIEPEQAGELKKGYGRILAPSSDDLEKLIEFKNGSLVLDDCRFYLRTRMEESIRRVLIRRRQNSNDIFAVAHGLTEVPASFYTFATHLVCFKTNDSLIRLRNSTDKEKIKKLRVAIDSVNAHPDHHHFKVFNISDI